MDVIILLLCVHFRTLFSGHLSRYYTYLNFERIMFTADLTLLFRVFRLYPGHFNTRHIPSALLYRLPPRRADNDRHRPPAPFVLARRRQSRGPQLKRRPFTRARYINEPNENEPTAIIYEEKRTRRILRRIVNLDLLAAPDAVVISPGLYTAAAAAAKNLALLQ